MPVESKPNGPSRVADDDCDEQPSSSPPTESLRDAGKHLAELQAYFRHYLDAKTDSTKLAFKRFVVIMVFSLVGLLIAGAMIATAGALLMIGLAEMIGSWFSPPKPWVGQVIVGVIALIGAPAATWFVVRRITGLCCTNTRQRYARKHARQRVRFGRDVEAAAAASETDHG